MIVLPLVNFKGLLSPDMQRYDSAMLSESRSNYNLRYQLGRTHGQIYFVRITKR